MTTRLETRFGAITALGPEYAPLAGPVPAGQRWNLNLVIANRLGSASNCRLLVARSPYPVHALRVAGAPPAFAAVPTDVAWGATDLIASGHSTGIQSIEWRGGYFGSLSTVSRAAHSLAWSPDGRWLAQTSDTDLVIHDMRARALGTQISVSLPGGGSGLGVAWSANGLFVFVGNSVTPFLHAYPFDPVAFTLGAVLNAPALAAAPERLRTRPAGTHVAGALMGSPFIQVVEWTGSAWGAISANPATLPAGRSRDICWSAAGAHLFAAGDFASPFVVGYPVGGAGAFGARFTAPGAVASWGLAYDAVGTRLYAQAATTALAAWAHTADALAALPGATLASAAPGAAVLCARPGGGTLHVGRGTSPFGAAYHTRAEPGYGTDLVAAILYDAVIAASGGSRKVSGVILNPGETLTGFSSVAGGLDITVSGVAVAP